MKSKYILVKFTSGKLKDKINTINYINSLKLFPWGQVTYNTVDEVYEVNEGTDLRLYFFVVAPVQNGIILYWRTEIDEDNMDELDELSTKIDNYIVEFDNLTYEYEAVDIHDINPLFDVHLDHTRTYFHYDLHLQPLVWIEE